MRREVRWRRRREDEEEGEEEEEVRSSKWGKQAHAMNHLTGENQ